MRDHYSPGSVWSTGFWMVADWHSKRPDTDVTWIRVGDTMAHGLSGRSLSGKHGFQSRSRLF